MNNFKTAVNKFTESPFFTISGKTLDFIEKEKLFKIFFFVICIIMAARTIVQPFIVLGKTINSGYFNFGVKYSFAFIFLWIALAAACWLGSLLWWKKRKKSAEKGTSEFLVIPLFSELIKTFGEWLGILLIVIGAVGGLFTLIFLGGNSGGMISAILGIGSNEGIVEVMAEVMEETPIVGGLFGFFSDFFDDLINTMLSFSIILGPVFGFLIIIITRFIAERLYVLAAIANNTKKYVDRLSRPAAPAPQRPAPTPAQQPVRTNVPLPNSTPQEPQRTFE